MIEGVEDDLFNLARKTGHAPETAREHFEAFAAAIRWHEPFILALGGLHLTLWLLFVGTRRRPTPQGALFLVLTALVAAAERLNTVGARHWRRFATQNYFDEHGVFAAAMYAGPMLALGFVMLFNFIRLAAGLLIEVKKEQIERELRAKKKKQEKTTKGEETAAPSLATKKEQ
mmetsp:Transcript_25753/g.102800  ORF Transcript_25753/g.102800 Transcript_25753/m.102800 type:complete len:173 (-) Transcript_25753:53-571(-)